VHFTQANNCFSIEEYLIFEESSFKRHEYINGKVKKVPTGPISHSQILVNILSLIHSFLKEKDADVFFLEIKVYIEKEQFFAYPDFCIVCGKAERWNNRSDTIINPAVLIEAHSKKHRITTGDKNSKLYRSIPLLNEYILVSSLEMSVEHYTKQSTGFWTFREITSPKEEFKIESIGFSCPVKTLYRDVRFEV
jgi:Uma2 family endonuclease